MSYLHASADALGSVFTVAGLVGLFIGIAWGLLVSFMPGVGGNVAIALLLPFIFRLPVPEAIALLLGTHIATYFGGSITSITMNIPASAKSVSLCWDGYPLARKGKAAYALGASATSSSLGGVVGAVALTLGIPVMKRLLNVIGPPEIFVLAVWGVVIIAIFSSGDLLKGVMAGGLGVLLSWVGESPITGLDRLTFGSTYLSLGIEFATAAIGLFAVAQAIRMLSEWRQQRAVASHLAPGEHLADDRVLQESTTWSGGRAVLKRWRLGLYMALFGVFTGTVPGLGAPVAAIAAYGQAAQMSKNKAEFGKGAVEGVIAPQATESAAEGGGMLPMLALGIPTHEQQAILLSAFVVLGLAPGPTMLTEHLSAVFAVIWIIVLASLIVGVIGMLAGRTLARLSTLSPSLLIPLILAIAIIGSFAINGRIGDSVSTIAFGVVGYLCFKYNYSRVNLIIGFALGPIFETNLHLSTQLYGSDFVVRRPGAALLAALVLLTIVWWFWRGKPEKRPADATSVDAEVRRPGWAAIGVAAGFVAVFAVAASVASTYGLLTGGVVLITSLFCLVLAVVNVALLLRLQLRHDSAAPAQPASMALAPAGVVAYSGQAEPVRGTAVPNTPTTEALRTVDQTISAQFAGGAPTTVPGTSPATVGTGDRNRAGTTGLVNLALQRRHSREESAGRVKGYELASTLVVIAFLGVVLLLGMTPGVGVAIAVYRYLATPSRSWRSAGMAVVWGLCTSAGSWLLFHTLVNQYFPYTGILHTG
jgi:putative tricarboxylic transport membrane protein